MRNGGQQKNKKSVMLGIMDGKERVTWKT